MKYPFTLVFRYPKYATLVDPKLIENEINGKLDCTVSIIDKKDGLNQLFNPANQILITVGPEESEYIQDCNSVLSKRLRCRWIHVKEVPPLAEFSRMVNYCFIHNCAVERSQIRPVFSIFSSSFNSYDKILRAYESLKSQYFKDWEWVIVDDSPDDAHFSFLRDQFLNDHRIRLYRRAENSGSIGNVKNESISLCRGKYLLELDHDDEIPEYVLSDSAEYFDQHPEVGFIYMDFINIFENGKNFRYGEFFGKGYSSYYCQKFKGHWRYVYITANVNNVTLSHLVCMPNHPRIWRKDVLMEAGSYCELLPINDDQEILMRTALITKIAKFHKIGYVQYMNENNNNFSLIRNAEINRVGPRFLQPMFYNMMDIHEKMKLKDAYEDASYIQNHSKIWKRNPETYQHNFCNNIVCVDFDKQYCVIGIDSLIKNVTRIRELMKNPRNDFFLIDNKASIEYIWSYLDAHSFDKAFKCYTLMDDSKDVLKAFFMMMYKSCSDYEIIDSGYADRPSYNTEFGRRHELINHLTNKNSTYLEIGIEYGLTYKNVHFLAENKLGVDPDPKAASVSTTVETCTANVFFEKYRSNDFKRDVILIDGMHQSDSVVDDFNNSIKYLGDNGMIFIDSILPLTYDEQRKVPNKHQYENGILKYGEPWTGDVWKVVYYLLLHHSSSFATSYFYHIGHRGIIQLFHFTEQFHIPEEAKIVINNYSFWEDFPEYVTLLKYHNVV